MIKYSIVFHCVVQQLFISSLIIDELEEVSLISSWLLKSVSVPRLHNLHGDKRGPYHMHKQMQDKIYKGSIPCMQQRQINNLKWFDSTKLIYTEATHFFLSSACLPCMRYFQATNLRMPWLHMLYYVSGLKSSKALAAEFRLRITLHVHRIVVPKWIWVHHWQQHCCSTPEFQVVCPAFWSVN